MSAGSIASALRFLKGTIKQVPVVGETLESIADLAIDICDRVEAVKENRKQLHELAEYQAFIYTTVAKHCKTKVEDDLNSSEASEQNLKLGLQRLREALSDIKCFVEKHQEVTTSPPTDTILRLRQLTRRAVTVVKELLDVNTVTQNIEELRLSLKEAVHLFGFELHLQTAGVVQEIYKFAAEARDGMDRLIEAFNRMNARMEDQSDLQQKKEIREEQIKWLKVADHMDNKTNARVAETILPNTCDWLFEHSSYQLWSQGDGGLLWLHGIAGSGKTVLASAVIRNLKLEESYDGRVVYHYCNVKESCSERDVLSNLLVQLLRVLASDIDIPGLEAQRHLDLLPTSDELLDHFGTAAKSAGQVLVVIDALDETEETRQLASRVRQLATYQNVRVLATFREPQVPIRESELSISLSEEAASVNLSIALYIKCRMDMSPLKERITGYERDNVIATLVTKASGMFRLAQCQIDHLERNCFYKAAWDKALATLPVKLDKMYDLILRTVPEYHAQIVERTLLWIFGARASLTLEQLVEALKIDEDEPEVHEEWRVQPRDVLLACRSLVSFDENTDTVRLSHSTVVEYLAQHSKRLPLGSDNFFSLSDVHVRLALQCLTYLCLPVSGAQKFQTNAEFEERCSRKPLVQYAAFAWPKHVAMVPSFNEKLFNRISSLVDDSDAGLHYCAHLQISKDYYPGVIFPGPQPEPAWPTIVLCRQKWLIEGIFSLHRDWLTMHDATYTTPLMVAVFHDLADVVELFVSLGARFDEAVNVPNDDDKRTPLYVAARWGHVATCKVLLGSDADANVGAETPIHIAAWRGWATVVCLLLEHKNRAKRDLCDPHNATALHLAVGGRNEDVVRQLIEHRFNLDARDEFGIVPLEIALQLHQPSLVQLLLTSGARAELVNLTVDDVEWARGLPWHADLSSTLLHRPEIRRLTANEIQHLFRDICTLFPGLPESIVVSMLDLAELWISYSVASSKRVVVTQRSAKRSYLRLSIPLGSHARAVKFVMVSCDQGWSSWGPDQGTYRNSWTWFDVMSSDSRLQKRIQTNVHASSNARTHRVTWDYSFLERNPEWRSALCDGEEIRLVPRALCPGWVHHVRSAEIEILCAFDPSVSLTASKSDTSGSVSSISEDYGTSDDDDDDDDDHYGHYFFDHHYYGRDDDDDDHDDHDNDHDHDSDSDNDDNDDTDDNDDEGSSAYAEGPSYDD